MFKLKNLKRKSIQSNSSKHSSIENHDYVNDYDNEIIFNEKQINLLKEWLDELNEKELIIITDNNDIVIMPGGIYDKSQQIFINSSDIDYYMNKKYLNNKNLIKIEMIDIANILFEFNYINQTSGQLSFHSHFIKPNNKHLLWLKSNINNIQFNDINSQIEIELSNNKLFISYEDLKPTNDIDLIGNYLFKNGIIQYDVIKNSYTYRYIKSNNNENISDYDLLSFHIHSINIDKLNKKINIKFEYDKNNDLILSDSWFNHLIKYNFNRNYIINLLLSNGKIINNNKFIFNNNTYLLKSNQFKIIYLSLKDKINLIEKYIDLIINIDGIKYDQINCLFVLENCNDNKKLFFNKQHSLFIKNNNFQRKNVIEILIKFSLIKKDQFNNYYLYYNYQFLLIPKSIINLNKQIDLSNLSHQRYYQIIDYMYYNGLITWDKKLNLIKIHFIDQTLLLPIDHLSSIIDKNIFNYSLNVQGILPFTSQQLSSWLINNSYQTHQLNN